jgi:hypothetical protein
MIRTTVLAAAFTALSGFAQAETIEMTRPVQAAVLHDGAIDLVVYYVDRGDHFEVVATYTAKAGPFDLQRLRMGLADGDSTQFSLPGHLDTVYSFERDGGTVHVRAEPTRSARS